MRGLVPLALAALLLLAGCNSAVGPEPTDGPEGAVGGNATVSEPRADPETDPLGWENGYWYDDPVAVNATDGLNASEREAVVARAMARVEKIRRLEFNRTVNVSVVRRGNYSPDGGPTDPGLRTFDNAKFEAAFLVGEDEDSIDTQQSSRNRTTGGYYDTGSGEIVLVSDSETPTLRGEEVLAHELTHALQDQYFNLSVRDARFRDGYAARLGLIEGDASVVQAEYRRQCGEAWSCLDGPDGAGAGAGAELEEYGIYLLEYFPYSDGATFVSALRAGENWSRVNDAYDAVPVTAQEIIDPSAYGRIEVRTVELADRTAGGWERVRPEGRPDYGRLGRSGLGAMFARTVYDDTNRTRLVSPLTLLNYDETGGINRTDPLNYDLEMTRGWAGDRLHVYQRGDDLAYVWRLAWESPAAADRFADAYRRLLAYWGGQRVAEEVWVIDEGPFADAFRVRVDGDTVTVTNAPTRAELDEVRRP
jgi:hypothetical protein